MASSLKEMPTTTTRKQKGHTSVVSRVDPATICVDYLLSVTSRVKKTLRFQVLICVL